ncbi:hypothetical protein [Nocardia sp. NPDC051570]|uniref:hypothetical protein n=1 Tax=Nocardia sp. NPDC051570 TaxID=3364324 RepID=UPI0037B3FB87
MMTRKRTVKEQRTVDQRKVRLGELMAERKELLGLSLSVIEVYLARATWLTFVRGEFSDHPHEMTFAKIEQVLGWLPGSCRVVLQGGHPPVPREVTADKLLTAHVSAISPHSEQSDRHRIAELQQRSSQMVELAKAERVDRNLLLMYARNIRDLVGELFGTADNGGYSMIDPEAAMLESRSASEPHRHGKLS